jgi:hypothetical protein
MILHRIGYWKMELDDAYPCPQELEAELMPSLRERLLAYLEAPDFAARVCWSFCGLSWCRYGCDDPNGSAESTDGVWVWPEGLAHYVREHHVGAFPDDFMARVLAGPKTDQRGSTSPVRSSEVSFDDSRWVTWGRKFRTPELTTKLTALGKHIAARRAESLIAAGLANAERYGLADDSCWTDGCDGRALRINPLCGQCFAEAMSTGSRHTDVYQALEAFVEACRR